MTMRSVAQGGPCGVALGLLLAVAPARLEADTVIFKPSADTTLHEESPGNNLGRSVPMAGTTAHTTRNRALFRFDLSSLPPAAVVSSATLKFKVVRTPSPSTASNFDVRRVLKSWGEGTKGSATDVSNRGALAAANEATWQARLAPATLWTSPGGAVGTDFSSTVSATTRLTGNATYTFGSTAQLVADVQAWLTDPDSNFGWVLMTQAEGTTRTVRRIGGRESTADSPTLEVVYSVPTPAQPPTLSQPQKVGDQIRFTFPAEANRAYTVEASSTLTPVSWQVFQAVPASVSATTVEVTDTLGQPHRFYRVRTP
jgi:hypothetical protein